MRKIAAGLFISLDGVVEAPQNWHLQYFNDEMGAIVGGQMAGADTLLLGRNTYLEFAGHWAHQGSEVPFADTINGFQKFVVSTTLESADWQNSTLISKDVAARITEIKEADGADITVTGSPTLVRSLLQENLLDELSLLVHPIVVGKGLRLFVDGFPQQQLALAESKILETGVAHLVYRPA